MDDLEGIPKPGNWLPVLLLALVILPIVMCLSSHRSVGGIGAMLDATEDTVVAYDRDSCSFTLSDVTGCLEEAGFAEDGESSSTSKEVSISMRCTMRFRGAPMSG